MTARPVLRAASGGIIRRPVQTAVLFVVLAVATAAALLGGALLAGANEAFLSGFAGHRGADVAVTVDLARVSDAQLAATEHAAGVTRAGGPYPALAITTRSRGEPGKPGDTDDGPLSRAGTGRSGGPSGQRASGGPHGGPGPRGGPGQGGGPGTGNGATTSRLVVIGRPSRGGPVDDLSVQQGHWLTGPGQIVLAGYYGSDLPVGTKVTVTSAPGRPALTVVGYAGSPGRFGAAWVTPEELAALRGHRPAAAAQMLYTFDRASNAREIAADIAALRAALPAGAITSYESWLGSAGQTSGEQSANTPFILAFALIGLVLAGLIVAVLVSGAVAASYRRIGVLKSIGFTPAQVTAVYLAQIGLPTLGGLAAGTVAGNLWAGPMLNTAASLFDAGVQRVPLGANVGVPAGMCLLTGLAALVPALRAGRLSAVQAITAGQAPRPDRGYAAHRLAGRLGLPRPVTIGLAGPFSRPARMTTTLAAVVSGVTAVILAVGLSASLAAMNDLSGQGLGQFVAGMPKSSSQLTLTPRQVRRAAAAIRDQPGTLHEVALADDGRLIRSVRMPGMPELNVVAYDGDATWLGWPLITGHWYDARGELDVNAQFLLEAGLRVGDTVRLRASGRPVTARIAGEVYSVNGPSVYASWQTLSGSVTPPRATRFAIALRPGTRPGPYLAALSTALGPGFEVNIPSANSGAPTGPAAPPALIRLLTTLIIILASLGVLASVLMLARERVHDLGVFKALGMTPRQVIVMVLCWVLAPATIAAAIAIPAAIIMHGLTIHEIGTMARSGAPAITVYQPAELLLLALSGLAIAAAGALLPASWAATSATSTSLRTE